MDTKNTISELADMFAEPVVGKTYEHFKGGQYKVVDKIPDGEKDGETTVIYENITTGQKFTRSLTSWNSKAEVERFKPVKTFMDFLVGKELEAMVENSFPSWGVRPLNVNLGAADKIVEDFMKEIYGNKNVIQNDADMLVFKTNQEKPDIVRNTKFNSYVRKEIVSAKVLDSEDIDRFGKTIDSVHIGFVLGPRQKDGRVVEHSGVIGEDYLLQGDGFIKVVSKAKFEEKYKL